MTKPRKPRFIQRTPLHWIEVDPSASGIPCGQPSLIGTGGAASPLDQHDRAAAIDQQDLTEAIGYVARQLHIVAHFERNIHKAFVRRTKTGQYDFGFRRYLNDQLVAILTALTDNRVRVDYHDGRESEILYL